jgi:hypothetical protein
MELILKNAQLIYPPNTSVSGRVGLTIDGNRVIHNEHCFTFSLPNNCEWVDIKGKFMEARTPDGVLQAVVKVNE